MDHADGHRYFEGLAVAHVLGGLDDSEGRVFRSHLLECGECRARVGELRAIAHDLADVERAERRVRAAQAIDTKRRETDEESDELADPAPSARSSRITVIAGLMLIIGLSLWNFTLRQSVVNAELHNQEVVRTSVLVGTGTPWIEVRSAEGIDGKVAHKDDAFAIAVDGLDVDHDYNVYVLDSNGVTATHHARTDTGQLMYTAELPAQATGVVVTDPAQGDEAAVGGPDVPVGTRVFEAKKPFEAEEQ